jgi:rare lipoprotein A (peptidoglycan hydrolase)
MSKRQTNAIAAMTCMLALTGGASLAQAQTGGAVAPGGGTTPPPSGEPAKTAGSWTVYKKATWYGPGFWGNETACGMTLAPTTIGTAHKKLPCGTQVTFTYNGRSVAATVIDRGPYRKGYAWDLTKKAAKKVGFLAVGSGRIKATVTPAP